jgi:hypothetical protein
MGLRKKMAVGDMLILAMTSFPRAMRPAQQQMLTRLAVYAFLESQFANSPERRQQMIRYLASVFAAENKSVSVEGGRTE